MNVGCVILKSVFMLSADSFDVLFESRILAKRRLSPIALLAAMMPSVALTLCLSFFASMLLYWSWSFLSSSLWNDVVFGSSSVFYSSIKGNFLEPTGLFDYVDIGTFICPSEFVLDLWFESNFWIYSMNWIKCAWSSLISRSKSSFRYFSVPSPSMPVSVGWLGS